MESFAISTRHRSDFERSRFLSASRQVGSLAVHFHGGTANVCRHFRDIYAVREADLGRFQVAQVGRCLGVGRIREDIHAGEVAALGGKPQ